MKNENDFCVVKEGEVLTIFLYHKRAGHTVVYIGTLKQCKDYVSKNKNHSS